MSNQINSDNQKNMQRVITRIIILTSFCSSFLGSSINIVVPSIGADLSVSAASIGWLITVYAIVTCCLSVPFGKLADATGKNRVFLIGLGLISASCLAAFWARSFFLLIILRGLQGVGASMIFATNTAIIVACHPPEQRGLAIGKMLSGTYVGLASGPVLSGFLNQWFGWHSIFLMVSVSVAITLIPAAMRLSWKEDLPAKSPKAKQDITGNLLFIAMISCSMFGFANIGQGWWPPAFILCGILLGLVFVRAELKAADPVIDVRIFQTTPAYTLSNLAALFNYSATFAIGYYMSLYLQIDKGFSSQTAGLIMICQPLMMALFTSKAGSLSDRIPPYKLATGGMIICGACLIFFSFVKNGTPTAAVICALLVTGFGVAVFSSPNMNAIMSCVDRTHYGVASSVLATMRTLGQTTGIAITTIILNARLGSATLQEAPLADFEGCMQLSFWIFAAICFIGAAMSMKRKNL